MTSNEAWFREFERDESPRMERVEIAAERARDFREHHGVRDQPHPDAPPFLPGDTVVLIDQPHFGAVSVTAMAYHGAGNWRVSYEGVDGFSGVGPASSYVRVPEGWVDHPLFPAGRVRYGLSEAERVAALMQDHADPDLVAARDLWRAASLEWQATWGCHPAIVAAKEARGR